MGYRGIGLLLIGLIGCGTTREVAVPYQYTEFSGILQEEIRTTIRDVFHEPHITLLELGKAEGYDRNPLDGIP
ncbi:MAG: hypothetical protein LBU25_07125 [Treponema sp.]|jgi:hypothetical protein|nr:hypothetical protein [Treponema sp.]